jgi:hypothetical protein
MTAADPGKGRLGKIDVWEQALTREAGQAAAPSSRQNPDYSPGRIHNPTRSTQKRTPKTSPSRRKDINSRTVL